MEIHPSFPSHLFLHKHKIGCLSRIRMCIHVPVINKRGRAPAGCISRIVLSIFLTYSLLKPTSWCIKQPSVMTRADIRVADSSWFKGTPSLHFVSPQWAGSIHERRETTGAEERNMNLWHWGGASFNSHFGAFCLVIDVRRWWGKLNRILTNERT